MSTLVIIESMNDGEPLAIVGPLTDEDAQALVTETVFKYKWDAEFVYTSCLSSLEEHREYMESNYGDDA